MKKLLACAVFLGLFASTPALAEDLEFMLTNLSSSAIVAFHVSHAGTNQWEENLLEGAYLPSGNEISVMIADGRTTCVYDIRTEFRDGDVDEEYGLDLCDLGSYTFK